MLDYSVAAVDTENLVGPVGVAPTISVGDVIAPLGADRPHRQARGRHRDAQWYAATDNVGVATYRVFRNGVLLKSTTATSAQDTTLKGGQSYAYTVRAADAAANLSPPSAAVPVASPMARRRRASRSSRWSCTRSRGVRR